MLPYLQRHIYGAAVKSRSSVSLATSKCWSSVSANGKRAARLTTKRLGFTVDNRVGKRGYFTACVSCARGSDLGLFSSRSSALCGRPDTAAPKQNLDIRCLATITSYPGYLSLADLRDLPGANKKPKRVGRGPGSGLGKTCGRGHKGQKSRSGNHGLRDGTFIGGQTPLSKRLPKWGFTNNRFRQTLAYVNLRKLQKWIDCGRIDPTKPITLKVMYDSFLVTKIKHGVKLLNGIQQSDRRRARNKKEEITAEFRLKQPVYIECTRVSQSAIEGIETAGGTVVTKWFNRLGLRAHLKPNKFLHPDLVPKNARPPPKRMKYYTGYENRGYLSQEMQYKLRLASSGVQSINETAIPSHLLENPTYST